MLESFHIARSLAFKEACWAEKNALSERLLGRAPLRTMRPETIGDRSRLDLQWNGEELGLRTANRGFVPLHFADTITPGIAQMMEEFRGSKCPLPLASLRFRSGKDDRKGLWIDAANEHIKKLLEERTWCETQLARGWIIEAGQKRKHVVQKEGRLGLDTAPMLPWLPSFDVNNDEVPLLSHVALFSQPGPEVNRALIAAGFELLDEAKINKLPWAEWGAGYGNLTAAYASRLGAEHGWASEFDPSAAALLAVNAKEFFHGVATDAASADEHDARSEAAGAKARVWILDPPRSGFSSLLGTLKDNAGAPTFVLAYHCHHEGLSKDASLLRNAGYDLLNWSSVDAFPATSHHEVVSLWKKGLK